MLFLALKKVQMVKFTPPQALTTLSKSHPKQEFRFLPYWGGLPPPVNAIWKTQSNVNRCVLMMSTKGQQEFRNKAGSLGLAERLFVQLTLQIKYQGQAQHEN